MGGRSPCINVCIYIRNIFEYTCMRMKSITYGKLALYNGYILSLMYSISSSALDCVRYDIFIIGSGRKTMLWTWYYYIINRLEEEVSSVLVVLTKHAM